MKVFISWSGSETKSLAVAKALHAWLPTVVNAIEPWISTEGLRAGLKWNQQLERELDDTSFGIIVVTPWNQGSQWLNFEAGALSKRVKGSDSRVAPLLIDFKKPTDLVGPMASYQATLPEQESMKSLLVSINEALGDDKRPHNLLEEAFRICWPSFEAKLAEINVQFPEEVDPAKAPHPSPIVADAGDAMAEILASVRELTRTNALLRNDVVKRTRPVRTTSYNIGSDSAVNLVSNPRLDKSFLNIVGQLLEDSPYIADFSLGLSDGAIWIKSEENLSDKAMNQIAIELKSHLPDMKIKFKSDSFGEKAVDGSIYTY
ncbi:toll/interleukin-1 receptor domain-containing protein [Paeniglutamicibacter sp. NPDC091659]|uniref:toll/interleukin-1 receptor domain-containing protein n=1 Tax=Paeniglutamicibacter sp. NPDC091659 TaxID=3364389 RepID=UPI0038217CC7